MPTAPSGTTFSPLLHLRHTLWGAFSSSSAVRSDWAIA